MVKTMYFRQASMEIRLRPITDDDAGLIVKWRNSPKVYESLYNHNPITVESHLKYLHSKQKDGSYVQFIVELTDSEDTVPIGTTFLKNIDMEKSHAEFGMFIGDTTYRGRGFSSLAVKETLNHAFQIIGINKVYLSAYANNIAAIRSYEKAGFRYDGLHKMDVFEDGQLQDIIYMSIVKT